MLQGNSNFLGRNFDIRRSCLPVKTDQHLVALQFHGTDVCFDRSWQSGWSDFREARRFSRGLGGRLNLHRCGFGRRDWRRQLLGGDNATTDYNKASGNSETDSLNFGDEQHVKGSLA